jgi:hypothetical protein
VVVDASDEVVLPRSVPVEAMEGVSDLWRLRVRGRGGLGVAGRLEPGASGLGGWVVFLLVGSLSFGLRGEAGRLVVR